MSKFQVTIGTLVKLFIHANGTVNMFFVISWLTVARCVLNANEESTLLSFVKLVFASQTWIEK